MAHVRLIHWNGPEGRERRLRLASLGHQADFDDLTGQALLRALRTSTPDAYLIDLSRMPSHGRAVAMWLRSRKQTQHIPILFVDGHAEKVARLKELLPDATYTSWSRLKTALPKALARRVAHPVVPPSSIYTGRPLAAKLGIKPGMRVCIAGAPEGFAELLGPVDGATLTARPEAACDLFILFGGSRRELSARVASLARHVARQTVWTCWPKKTSGVKTDLDGNVVRELGLTSGWVDFKICAVDATWSGLAFKRRA